MKQNSIYFWRIIFTLMIVLLHFGISGGWYIAADFFFLVSGYLLAYKGEDHSVTPLAYGKKRIRQLYPQYLAAILLYFIAANIIYGTPTERLPLYFFQAIPQFLCLQSVGPAVIFPCNSPGWYVSALLIDSCILYFLFQKLRKNTFYLLCGILSVLCLGYFVVCLGNMDFWIEHHYYISDGLLRGFFEMYLGMLAFYINQTLLQKWQEIPSRVLDVIEYASFLVVIIGSFFLRRTAFDFLWLVLLFLGVLLAFRHHDTTMFQNRKLRSLSDLTYTMFLFHSFWATLIFAGVLDVNDNKKRVIFVLPYLAVVFLTSWGVQRLSTARKTTRSKDDTQHLK